MSTSAHALVGSLATLSRLPPPRFAVDGPLIPYTIDAITTHDDAARMRAQLRRWPRSIIDPRPWIHLTAPEKAVQTLHASRARSRLLLWLSLDCTHGRPLYLTLDEAVALITALCWLPPPSTWHRVSADTADCPIYQSLVSSFTGLLDALDVAGVYPE